MADCTCSQGTYGCRYIGDCAHECESGRKTAFAPSSPQPVVVTDEMVKAAQDEFMAAEGVRLHGESNREYADRVMRAALEAALSDVR